MVDYLVNEFYRKGIVMSGEFTLKSGEKSDLYFEPERYQCILNY